ncbi:hypothetical protein CHU94_09350 [Rhodoferax sp. TH121]|uniref:helix-turn-helix domain-containing protein n=1 Tax=Rhodoferax sp. TH121 TaxID=2022803 RepID=UPI000B96E7E3|nr:RodZ domain-containing protein [Rhodoferax sp. TH121]OYQ41283.1 hypothetical protein CHU94_09350 [Rhodoferax sp. TH121]
MSEVSSLPTADSVVSDESPALVTAGALLRAAREAAGLHVAALAVSMKVPVKKLEALEADRFDLLPDAVFVRALASSVCRTLKIDPAPVLSKLPHQHVPRLGASEGGINTPFHAAGERRSFSVPAALRQPAVIVVMVLLAAALGVFLFPEWQADTATNAVSISPETVQLMPTSSSDAPDPVPPVAVEPVAIAAVAVASAPEVLTQSPPVVVAPVAVAAPPLGVGSAPVPLVGQHLVFRVKGASWVEVTDAKGQVLMRRNLIQGDDVGVSGALPLSVVVGRADVTDVEVKGKPFNLAAIAKDNVARFEVK